MKTIARKRYLDTLRVLKDKNFIKVATSVRRCGKSTLMTQFQDLLRAENDDISILANNTIFLHSCIRGNFISR